MMDCDLGFELTDPFFLKQLLSRRLIIATEKKSGRQGKLLPMPLSWRVPLTHFHPWPKEEQVPARSLNQLRVPSHVVTGVPPVNQVATQDNHSRREQGRLSGKEEERGDGLGKAPDCWFSSGH